MKAVFGILAVLINLIGYIPYIKDIVAQKIKPQRVTWGVWTILTTIAFSNQVINGGGWSAWFLGSTALLVTITFVLSIRNGVGGSSKLDKVALIFAGVLLIYWLTVHDTRLSTILAIIIDAIGATPTLIKAYKKPKTESYPQWVMAAIAGVFSLLAIAKADFILAAFPLYVILMNSLIVSAKYSAELPTNRKK